MPPSGRLRRKAASFRRRAQPAPVLQRERAGVVVVDAQPHDVEIFSEDFKLLRTLLILLFSLLVIYVGKTLDRWTAATTIHEHLENQFFDAVQTNLLTAPLELPVSGARVDGLPSIVGRVRIEPEAGAAPRMLADVAAQALHALKARGIAADHISLSLALPDEVQRLHVEVGTGPLHPALADQFRALPLSLRDIEGMQANYAQASDSCVGTPVGASMRFLPAAQGEERWEEKSVKLRAMVPQAEIGIDRIYGTGHRYEMPQFKLLMFYAPDVYQLKSPIRCARAYAPALATWNTPEAPNVRMSPGAMAEGPTSSLHKRRPAKDFAAAREEMEASNFKAFDMLQVSFDNLFFLFPLVLLVLSAISSSVLRRIALSLPEGVAAGDVLLNRRGSRRVLSVMDGVLVRGIEKMVRILLLTVAIFCPFIVMLTVPVVADAGLSYGKASQPVIFLYEFAGTLSGAVWLFPLAASLLLAVHQWSLIMSPPGAPLTQARPVRWALVLLLGFPSTLFYLFVGAVCVYMGIVGAVNFMRSQPLDGTAAKVIGIHLIASGLGLMLIAVLAGFWWWVMRSPWPVTRRGHRTVIGCCAVGAAALAWPVADLFKPDVTPESFRVMSAIGCGWCLWMLRLALQSRRHRGWHAVMRSLTAWARRRFRSLPP